MRAQRAAWPEVGGAAMRTCGEVQTTVEPGQHIEPDADVRSPG